MTLREQIEQWCDINMDRVSDTDAPYPKWETHCLSEDCLIIMLRIMADDTGAEIYVCSCGARRYVEYDDAAWGKAYMGRARNVEEIAAILAWMKARHKPNTVK